VAGTKLLAGTDMTMRSKTHLLRVAANDVFLRASRQQGGGCATNKNWKQCRESEPRCSWIFR